MTADHHDRERWKRYFEPCANKVEWTVFVLFILKMFKCDSFVDVCDFLRQETCSGYDFENKLKLKIDIAMKKMEERAKKELVTSDSSG